MIRYAVSVVFDIHSHYCCHIYILFLQKLCANISFEIASVSHYKAKVPWNGYETQHWWLTNDLVSPGVEHRAPDPEIWIRHLMPSDVSPSLYFPSVCQSFKNFCFAESLKSLKVSVIEIYNEVNYLIFFIIIQPQWFLQQHETTSYDFNIYFPPYKYTQTFIH